MSPVFSKRSNKETVLKLNFRCFTPLFYSNVSFLLPRTANGSQRQFEKGNQCKGHLFSLCKPKRSRALLHSKGESLKWNKNFRTTTVTASMHQKLFWSRTLNWIFCQPSWIDPPPPPAWPEKKGSTQPLTQLALASVPSSWQMDPMRSTKNNKIMQQQFQLQGFGSCYK